MLRPQSTSRDLVRRGQSGPHRRDGSGVRYLHHPPFPAVAELADPKPAGCGWCDAVSTCKAQSLRENLKNMIDGRHMEDRAEHSRERATPEASTMPVSASSELMRTAKVSSASEACQIEFYN